MITGERAIGGTWYKERNCRKGINLGNVLLKKAQNSNLKMITEKRASSDTWQ